MQWAEVCSLTNILQHATMLLHASTSREAETSFLHMMVWQRDKGCEGSAEGVRESPMKGEDRLVTISTASDIDLSEGMTGPAAARTGKSGWSVTGLTPQHLVRTPACDCVVVVILRGMA